MKYFKYKRLMKKRKAFANIELFYGGLLSHFDENDKRLILEIMYKIHQVVNVFVKLAPIFVYAPLFYFHYYLEPYMDPLYAAILFLILSTWFTEIYNENYIPEELENVSQWMYKAGKNRFRLLILRQWARTYGAGIFFYCLFVSVYLGMQDVQPVKIFLYGILGVAAAVFTIAARFYWSNYPIFYLFFYGPNYLKQREFFVKQFHHAGRNSREPYLVALARSCQNRTYYIYVFYIYVLAIILPITAWWIAQKFNVHAFVIITVYMAVLSVLVSFIVQGIINSSKMIADSNLSDYYYIKRFDKKKYYENMLSRFFYRKLFVILLSYYTGLFILCDFSVAFVISVISATAIYVNVIKMVVKRVYRFNKFSIEEVKGNFFIYFFNPFEDLLVIGAPVILSSVVAVFAIKAGSIYYIMLFYIVYSIILSVYNFLKER